ncbi:hypothetical protein F4778DRAFT_781831 [Xylariomycetidae sp. FL2044]|nr:hypothetical protein F4778DRAFT_781831 [Xylariomycetidae sp. FL2044]
MAKDKAEKKPKADKAEKKHKREKKSKLEDTPDSSPDEPTDIPVAAEPIAAADDAVKPKKEKKSKKSKDKTSDSTESSEPVAIDAEGDTEMAGAGAGAGAQLFMIDTKPTRVDPSTIAEKTDPEPEEAAAPGEEEGEKPSRPRRNNKAPSGLNRNARRRIMLIERQRDKIRKKLGVAEGSRDRDDEVQAELDQWVQVLDGKAALRTEKERARKEKEANRLRNKRGKALTGRKLKERKKQVDKMEKKASKKSSRS